MNKFCIIIIFTLLIVSCTRIKVEYPETKKVNQIDNYFGREVSDPYRWLEDNNSDETKKWIKKQKEITSNYLSQIPFRNKIKERLTELSNYERMYTPTKKGGYYFYYKNDGLQDQDVLYMIKNLEDEPRIVINPNELSEDGTISLVNYSVSKDGQYLAYSLANAGSDWREIFVKNLITGEQLKDHIKWVKFSGISWYKDGFFYSKYAEPEKNEELSIINKDQKVYYHKVGQQQDEIIYENPKYPLRYFYTNVTDDEKYLIIYESESTSGNSVFIKNLAKNKEEIVQLTTGFDYEYKIIDNEGDDLFVVTNYKAPKYKLITIDVNRYDVGNWKDIIPEKEHVLNDCNLAGNKFFAHYIQHAHSKVDIYDIKGNFEKELSLSTLGTLSSFNGKKEENTAFYSFTSFTHPITIYKYNISENKSEIYFKPEVNFDFNDYVIKQVFLESKDGTRLPMFIVCNKNISMNGNNPTLLYGYGGFNISLTPWFSINDIIWLENGGVSALANIRGGGEYGEKWHKAGTKLNKQNVFDDFISAAEYLIRENYTSSKKLAIQGGSNGGLLVGAVTNQRPDLIKVALPAVGVMDMLRFHKFTIGWAWIEDYGSSEDSTDFLNLYKYSPLHNIKEDVKYPAVFVTTADHDDRVVPAHSYKYIATLQEKNRGKNPTLIRIQSKAGHGFKTPTSIRIEENTDIFTFTFYNLGVTPEY